MKIRKIGEYWNSYWFSQIPAYPLAAFRILFGLYLLIYFGWSLPFVTLFFSNEGVYSPFLIPDIAPSPAIAIILYLFTLLLIMAFTLGFKTRWVTPLMTIALFYHIFLNIAVKFCSYEHLIVVFLVILCFGDLDRVWSINKTKSFDGSDTTSAWVTRLLALHVFFFYFETGFYKVLSHWWHTGEMIRMTLLSDWGTPIAFKLVQLNLPSLFWDISVWGIVIFELTCAFFFYIKPLQKYFFLGGLIFHTSVWAFMQIPQFMICPLTYVLFIPSAEVKKVGDTISKFVQKIYFKYVKKKQVSVSSSLNSTT